MTDSFFVFFRGTFYRWVQWWPKICQEAASAPHIVAVGDLHVENFGTWRDLEGRLVWGINDFDETFPMSYLIDLIRLQASVRIAAAGKHVKLGFKTAAKLILEGYREGLKIGGRAFVLAEQDTPLREMARNRLRNPEKFWSHLQRQRKAPSPPGYIRNKLRESLPKTGKDLRYLARVAGVGSLGHERYVAIGEHQGGLVAREAKTRVPSACVWAGAHGKKDYYRKLVEKAVRCPDPYLELTDKLVVRRLSPDCSRLELTELPERFDEKALLYAMGLETANVHLANRDLAPVSKHLKKITPAYLDECADKMVSALAADWKRWRKGLR